MKFHPYTVVFIIVVGNLGAFFYAEIRDFIKKRIASPK